MKTIIITGAESFIGRSIIPALKKKYILILLSRSNFDLLSDKCWDELNAADIVIHLAALTSIGDSWSKPEEYLTNNISVTLKVLKYCRKNKAKLITLSSYMYGNSKKIPVDENQQVKAINPYALSKQVDEDVVSFYVEHFQLDAVILRLFNVYGPGQSNQFLIGQMIEEACQKKSITVNDLKPKRDYIHINDVVSVFLKLMSSNQPFKKHIFNVCSGKSFSVEEIAEKIRENLPFKVEIINKDIRRKNEIMDSLGTYDRLYECYDWEPITPIDVGIKNLVNEKLNEIGKV
jgi:nucleoside-diphosphate-sugar epimerase